MGGDDRGRVVRKWLRRWVGMYWGMEIPRVQEIVRGWLGVTAISGADRTGWVMGDDDRRRVGCWAVDVLVRAVSRVVAAGGG